MAGFTRDRYVVGDEQSAKAEKFRRLGFQTFYDTRPVEEQDFTVFLLGPSGQRYPLGWVPVAIEVRDGVHVVEIHDDPDPAKLDGWVFGL